MSAANRTLALRHFREGNGYFERSRFAEALARYRNAVKAWDHPAIRYNMAVSQVHLDRPLKAYFHLKRALRFGRAPLGTKVFRQALTYLKLIKGRLAFVWVRCRQPGTRVHLDGKLLFVAPGAKRLVVLPGKHALVASREGFLTQSRSPFLIPGKQSVLRVSLVPVSAAIRMKRRWKRWWPWTTLGAGALAAVIGASLLVQARKDIQAYDDEVSASCPSGCLPGEIPSAVTDLKDRARNEYVTSFVAFGLGGAALVAGITLVILNQPRAMRVQILPTTLPGGGGVTAHFRF